MNESIVCIYDLTKKIDYLKTENLNEANCYVLNTYIRKKQQIKLSDVGSKKTI